MIGRFSGCIFSKLNSGIFAPFPEVNNVIPTATVPITKIAPKIGYILPIILSIGKIVDKKKYRNIMTKIIHKAILPRSEEHTSELQSRGQLVCRLLLEKKQRARKTSQ